jgi:DNA-binding transcriptional LysR family regulator
MDDLLAHMALFVAVGKTKSFTRASRELGMPISSLSRRIAALEAKVGVRLLHRSTRKLELTEAGARYLERARSIIEAAAQANAELKELADTPTGHLRISMAPDFGEVFLTPLFAEYARRHPRVSFDFDMSPGHVDLVAEGYDAAIRIGAQADSGLTARKLTTARIGLFANAEYLARCGEPATPSDVEKHECLRQFRARDRGQKLPWTLHRGKERIAVRAEGRVTANGPRMLQKLAKLGMGIVALDELLVTDDLDSGALLPVLPEWSFAPEVVYVVTPSKLLPAKTKLLIACLEEHLAAIRKRASRD